MSHHHKKDHPDQTPNDWANVPETGTPEMPENPEPAQEAPAADDNPILELSKELAATKEKAAELEQKLLYLQADYQNYRKRTAKDIAEARVLGTSNALSPFLNVYDFLGMAGTAAEKSENIESIRQGLKMIIGEFNKAFDEIGVKKVVTAVGTPFDPELHEAVSHQPDANVPEGQVLKEWAGGFKLGERLLRPARVVVSAGVPKAETAGDHKED